ncbi:MAG: toll/interleukin-1 receptor domain-containing protein [Desulfobacteraceae bacterium]|jgi:uncharacterized protein YjbI with pentapeptide repeats|nr:toll/interleukin-1 receptor domain-containing protein [Desulfobacteraceae bacterium]
MPNQQHLAIVKQGVDEWNKWRDENPEIEPDLSDVDFSSLKLNNANLSDTDFRRAKLKNTDFRSANLVRADLRAANIRKSSFNLAKLREANFSEAYLRESDLSEADLKRAYFIRADLVRVDLWETDLTRADFRWAYLIGTDLRQANLTRADLRWAHLSESNLSDANLNKASLVKASIIKTNLRHSNFKDVLMAWTHFGDVDLSLTEELYTARHYGPSSIGIDTIMRSDGKIPETFLREAGVSDNIIQNIALLTEKGLSYQSCFISHSAKDCEFAEKLYADLQNRGVRCWFASEDMKLGQKTWDSIYHYIRMRDKILLILSEDSIPSDWVENEVNAALAEENKRKKPIFLPIRVDTAVLDSDQSWAEYIKKTRNICDFSNWKDHDAYHQALDKLLDDIKISD